MIHQYTLFDLNLIEKFDGVSLSDLKNFDLPNNQLINRIIYLDKITNSNKHHFEISSYKVSYTTQDGYYDFDTFEQADDFADENDYYSYHFNTHINLYGKYPGIVDEICLKIDLMGFLEDIFELEELFYLYFNTGFDIIESTKTLEFEVDESENTLKEEKFILNLKQLKIRN